MERTSDTKGINVEQLPTGRGAAESADIRKLIEERGEVYGDIGTGFTCASELITAYLTTRGLARAAGSPLVRPHDVAMLVALLKVSRVANGSFCADNYDDIGGYVEIAKRLQAMLPNE